MAVQALGSRHSHPRTLSSPPSHSSHIATCIPLVPHPFRTPWLITKMISSITTKRRCVISRPPHRCPMSDVRRYPSGSSRTTDDSNPGTLPPCCRSPMSPPTRLEIPKKPKSEWIPLHYLGQKKISGLQKQNRHFRVWLHGQNDPAKAGGQISSRWPSAPFASRNVGLSRATFFRLIHCSFRDF